MEAIPEVYDQGLVYTIARRYQGALEVSAMYSGMCITRYPVSHFYKMLYDSFASTAPKLGFWILFKSKREYQLSMWFDRAIGVFSEAVKKDLGNAMMSPRKLKYWR